mmetsp:Transcript_52576/g.139584  ORF Transcript_52576/g.139584 Transcript_52576/m.139584 type:complete len:176 (-) Transcript_52576:83-610(-)
MHVVLFGAVASMLLRGNATLTVAKGKDPQCRTGLLSFEKTDMQVCCPAYCKECTDYPTCKSVFGEDTKDSSQACCVSVVIQESCEVSSHKLGCIKSCENSLPPCTMKPGEEFVKPEEPTAAADCGKAVDDWKAMAEAAKEGPSEQTLLQIPSTCCPHVQAEWDRYQPKHVSRPEC